MRGELQLRWEDGTRYSERSETLERNMGGESWAGVQIAAVSVISVLAAQAAADTKQQE